MYKNNIVYYNRMEVKFMFKKMVTLLIAVIMLVSCFSYSASAGTKMTQSSSATGTVTLAVGSRSTIVGKSVMVYDSGLNASGLNVCGWRTGTNTLNNCVGVSAATKYTGYVTIDCQNYNTGTTVISSSRSVGSKSSGSTSNTWYKELKKDSYTATVTSFATVEAVYSSSDNYFGYPNAVNVSK